VNVIAARTPVGRDNQIPTRWRRPAWAPAHFLLTVEGATARNIAMSAAVATEGCTTTWARVASAAPRRQLYTFALG